MLLVEFVSALLCGGVARDEEDEAFGIIRLGNSILAAASVITLEFHRRSHDNVQRIINILDFEALVCFFAPAFRSPTLFLAAIVSASTTVLALLAESSPSLGVFLFLDCPSS